MFMGRPINLTYHLMTKFWSLVKKKEKLEKERKSWRGGFFHFDASGICLIVPPKNSIVKPKKNQGLKIKARTGPGFQGSKPCPEKALI